MEEWNTDFLTVLYDCSVNFNSQFELASWERLNCFVGDSQREYIHSSYNIGYLQLPF